MRFCFHNWTRWSAPHHDAWAGEDKMIQTRCCTDCGKVQIGRVKQPIYSRVSLKDVLLRLAELMEEK